MELHIDGLSKNINNEKLKVAIEWLGKRLLSHQLYPHITVHLELIYNLRRKRGLYGFCRPSDAAKCHRTFEIVIDSSVSQKNMLLSLCHEMVHVKQFAYGELNLHCDHALWLEKKLDQDQIDYWDRPWEIEAHGRERGLFLYLADHFDDLGI